MSKLRRVTSAAWISRQALEAAITEAERRFPMETGGVLIGYWVKPLVEVVITVCSTPGQLAKHTGAQYVPDSEHDEAEIARHYRESGRQHSYLGDWHSHPDEAPYLSRMDIHTLKRIAAHPAARTRDPLMAILGGHPGGWDLAVWCYASARANPITLQVMLYDP